MAKVVEVGYGYKKTGRYEFYCPACGHDHVYHIGFNFNGNVDRPTFTPSLKNTKPDGSICHLNVTNGFITYHSDCSYEMRGKVIEMEEIYYDI